MIAKDYEKAKIGDTVELISRVTRSGEVATIISFQNKPFDWHYGPVKVRFDDGEEMWVSHRYLKFSKKYTDDFKKNIDDDMVKVRAMLDSRRDKVVTDIRDYSEVLRSLLKELDFHREQLAKIEKIIHTM